jgi:Protein of unknown function (DUF2892)
MAATALFARNEGTIDRVVRIVLGIALLYFAFTGRGVWGYIGIVPLLTGLMGSCPLYSALGLNTCPVKR